MVNNTMVSNTRDHHHHHHQCITVNNTTVHHLGHQVRVRPKAIHLAIHLSDHHTATMDNKRLPVVVHHTINNNNHVLLLLLATILSVLTKQALATVLRYVPLHIMQARKFLRQ